MLMLLPKLRWSFPVSRALSKLSLSASILGGSRGGSRGRKRAAGSTEKKCPHTHCHTHPPLTQALTRLPVALWPQSAAEASSANEGVRGGWGGGLASSSGPHPPSACSQGPLGGWAGLNEAISLPGPGSQ